MTKIGVLGAGNVGGRLGRNWAAAGHDVMFGVREINERAQENAGGVPLGTMQEAAQFGEIIVLAIPGSSLAAIVPTLDSSGKIIIDTTNGGGTEGKSGAELVAELTPEAAVYKAFNSIGAENFDAPRFGELQADMFYCGANSEEGDIVIGLIEDMGFRPFYVGDLSKAGMLESVAYFWMTIARGTGVGRRMAFKMLTASDE